MKLLTLLQEKVIRTIQIAKAIGKVTFLEIIQDKVLYNIVLCAILLFGAGFLASRLTFIKPERVVLDFGLSAVALSCTMIGIFTGASLLVKEFERRTIYVALCHPISRGQFIFGKFAGLVAVLFVNWLLLSVSYLVILCISGENGAALISTTLFGGLFLVLIQSMLIASVSVLFSSFSTTSLSVIFSVGFYLTGNNITQLKLVAARLHSSFGSAVLRWIASMLPNFEYYSLGTKLTYGLPVSFRFMSWSVVYGTIMILLFLTLAGWLVQGREV